MMPFRFAGVELKVASDPPPARSSGHRWIKYEAPGADGIVASFRNGRMPGRVAWTVLARAYAELEVLEAMLDAGADGDLEWPHDGDAWVFEDAMVDGEVTWEQISHEDQEPEALYRARVIFVCPKPRPYWKSSGELVF